MRVPVRHRVGVCICFLDRVRVIFRASVSIHHFICNIVTVLDIDIVLVIVIIVVFVLVFVRFPVTVHVRLRVTVLFVIM